MAKRATIAEKIQHEYRDSDGYWIELTPGFSHFGEHQIHEDTKRDARSRLSNVTPCDCADCQEQPGYISRTAHKDTV